MKPPGGKNCRGLLIAVKGCSRRRKQRVASCGVCGSSRHHTVPSARRPPVYYEYVLCVCAADVTVTRNASYFYGTVRLKYSSTEGT